MKINNLLETVLIFIFSILLLNGCRTESNIDENKNIQTNIPQKKLRLKDVPELKNILTSNPKLFNKRVKFSINDSIEVFNINSKKLNSYSVQINPDNDSAFYIVTLSYDKLKNNKVSKLIGKFVPDNNTFEKNIKNFSGKSYFETITGTPIVNSIWKNGKVIDNKNIRNAKTASCTTQSYIVANMCSEDVHWPWEGGCQASGKAYFSISTSMNCDQEMIDPNWGGGGFGDSGGGGSNSIATMSSPDAINYLLAQIGMTSLNTQQYNFLASYPIIADYFKTYFWGDNQNIDGANFMNWGINFFMQNPNTTIEQFQNWFIDYAPDNFISEIVKHDPKTILEYDAISPSFTMRKLDQIKYPRFTLLLKTLRSKIEQNPTMINRLSKLSGLTNAQVLEKLTFGKGPLINIVPNLLGPSGPNYGNFDSTIPNQININANFVLGLEKSVLNTTIEATAFLLAVTVLHEFIHYGNHLTGYNTLGQEMGNLFEIDSYGIIITKYNASQYIISLNNK